MLADVLANVVPKRKVKIATVVRENIEEINGFAARGYTHDQICEALSEMCGVRIGRAAYASALRNARGELADREKAQTRRRRNQSGEKGTRGASEISRIGA